jgi:hypothetical protein
MKTVQIAVQCNLEAELRNWTLYRVETLQRSTCDRYNSGLNVSHITAPPTTGRIRKLS